MKFHDRALSTSTSTGTGNMSALAAAATYSTLAASFSLFEMFTYVIASQTLTEWEIGMGYLSDASTLVRTGVVYASTNSNGLVNFSAGTKDVFNSVTAKHMQRVASKGKSIAFSAGLAMP